MKNLDLYAKIEPLIGFYEEYEYLYEEYLHILGEYSNLSTVLDVGCGNGNLLLYLQQKYQAEGIDLSSKMVEIAKSKGANASFMNLKDVRGSYDAILAVADVLNYLDDDSLEEFLLNVSTRLEKGGIFVFDINSRFGFEEVTAGSMSVDEGDQFLSIEAEFLDEILRTEITLFERVEGSECFTKEDEIIFQYYHDIEKIVSKTDLKLVLVKDIALFTDASDKSLVVLRKL
jgi:SAM-dependent methyltransferase